MQSKKRARTADDTNGDTNQTVTSPSALSELFSRVCQLEESQGQVSELQTRVAVLEARVKELEGETIRAEDRDFAVGRSASRTILAIRDGETSVLAERLARGADPNHDDGLGGTCLIHSVVRGRPECTRLLIEHGANVKYCFPADNASVLYMLVRSFQDSSGYTFCRPGDFMLAADLLVDAGAPTDEVQDEARTALSVLQEIEAGEGTKRHWERDGLVAVLERRYWQDYGFNPFLRAPSPDAAAQLLLQGAANNGAGHPDITRVRSIKPDVRKDVLNALTQHGGMRDTFVHILLSIRDANCDSLFCRLRGHESTIIPVIAAYAGSTGWSRRKLLEAKGVLKDVIARFNFDGGSYDGLDGAVDDDGDDGDDDSYEVDDDDDDRSRDARDDEHMDELVDTEEDDGDY